MHELDYGSFEIKSDPDTGPLAARVAVTARCTCGMELRAAAESFVLAKNQIESRFVEHARAVREDAGE